MLRLSLVAHRMLPFSVRGAWLLASGCLCIQMNDIERLLQSCVQDDANPDWNTAVLTIIRSTRNQSRFIDVRFPWEPTE
jgi:hypothetical protein